MDADLVALLGLIATWIAVLLALIALIGIVGPLLVLRAFYSSRNQALNSIHDISGDFVSRGIGYRNFRLFHRVTVPKLVPDVNWDEYDAFVIPQTGKGWELGKVKGTSCRTGWARLCRLVGAYGVDMPRGGELVVGDSRETSLPVSKYWILSIGLLGRYGTRDDGGKTLNANPLRPDLHQLRVLTSEINVDRRKKAQSPWKRYGRTYSSSGSASEGGEMDSEGGMDDDVKSEHEKPSSRFLFVEGVTGEFRIKREFSIADMANEEMGLAATKDTSRLQFTGHNEQEMGLSLLRGGETSAVVNSREMATKDLSVATLYWLAAGFLPLISRGECVACLQTPEGIFGVDETIGSFSEAEDEEEDEQEDEQEVMPANTRRLFEALENEQADPQKENNNDANDNDNGDDERAQFSDRYRRRRKPKPKRHSFKDWTTISLLETEERPISIHEASVALNTSTTKILMFHPSTTQIALDLPSVSHLRALFNKSTPLGTSKWIIWRRRGRNSPSDPGPVFIPRRDVQLLVSSFLEIEWHPWSFLLWKKNNDFWLYLMRCGSNFLVSVEVQKLLTYWKETEEEEWQKPWKKVLREWMPHATRNIATFEQRRHKALLSMRSTLGDRIRTRGVKGPTNIIALLHIMNREFRSQIIKNERLASVEIDIQRKLVLLTVPVARGDKDRKDKDNELVHTTENIEPNTSSTKAEKSALPEIDIIEAANTTKTLEFAYDEDVFPPSWVLSSSAMPNGSSSSGNEKSKEQGKIEREGTTVMVEKEDIFIARMWAATSCALWLGAINAEPLLRMVDGLDEVVHAV